MRLSRGCDVKTLYLIGGTMGVGKTSVCRRLYRALDRSVFLDGDWCWDMHPFTVTEETKEMCMDNIAHMLNGFIRCSEIDNIVFCWVMHLQSIIDDIASRLDLTSCRIVSVSLTCDDETLKKRLIGDVNAGLREYDVIERSVARIPLYDALDTIKIDTTGKALDEIASEIAAL